MAARRSPAAVLIPGAALLLLLGVGYVVAARVEGSAAGRLHQHVQVFAAALSAGEVDAAYAQVAPAARSADMHAELRALAAQVRGAQHRLERLDVDAGVAQVFWITPITGRDDAASSGRSALKWVEDPEGAWGFVGWQAPEQPE